ncbi:MULTISPECIES: helix-turn-helix transcriptional regulator [Vitreoscilla]|uniref:AlpA family phage regulatory protein n=1 Tax=Vitreoscilla stercoraria TaxID=61 RepID=A0ABY4EIG0_VITST|nr:MULTISPECIES: AlpA family phage regulatory protein [Vitreoscilla]AUZ04072.2 hypothetical protein ADP71_02520 [Vitreoscilla sp. C1]UOO93162.1 AlpA family phage regulatory protein [Vitreoscilla stercoraria]
MQASNSIINLDMLPSNAQLTLKELASSPSKNKRGYTRLSESHIRRLEARGLFPRSRQVIGTRCRFYIAGEVRQWLAEQAQQKA